MDSSQRPDEIRVVEISLDSAQLGQLGDFPEHDRRDAPGLASEERGLATGQLTGEGAEKDVGVEIQHPIEGPSRGCCPC